MKSPFLSKLSKPLTQSAPDYPQPKPQDTPSSSPIRRPSHSSFPLPSSSFPRLLSAGHVTSNLLGHPLWLNTKVSNVNTSKGVYLPRPQRRTNNALPLPIPIFSTPSNFQREQTTETTIFSSCHKALQFIQHPLLFTECTGDVWARCMRYLIRCTPMAA